MLTSWQMTHDIPRPTLLALYPPKWIWSSVKTDAQKSVLILSAELLTRFVRANFPDRLMNTLHGSHT